MGRDDFVLINLLHILLHVSKCTLLPSNLATNSSEKLQVFVSCPPSEEQSRLAARKYARVVQKLGFPAKFLDFKIQNMVGSCDVKFPIRLEGLVLTHQQFSRYVSLSWKVLCGKFFFFRVLDFSLVSPFFCLWWISCKMFIFQLRARVIPWFNLQND